MTFKASFQALRLLLRSSVLNRELVKKRKKNA
jgi:hypothetical protein